LIAPAGRLGKHLPDLGQREAEALGLDYQGKALAFGTAIEPRRALPVRG
jgi:hypothetical protein